MTIEPTKLATFTSEAVGAVVRVNPSFHSPDRYCFEGECPWCLTNIKDGNWIVILNLARAFWNKGPEVDDNWKRCAREVGLDPEGFHELLLGVFVGGGSGAVDVDACHVGDARVYNRILSEDKIQKLYKDERVSP